MGSGNANGSRRTVTEKLPESEKLEKSIRTTQERINYLHKAWPSDGTSTEAHAGYMIMSMMTHMLSRPLRLWLEAYGKNDNDLEIVSRFIQDSLKLFEEFLSEIEKKRGIQYLPPQEE